MTATMTDAVDLSRWTRWSVTSCARASWPDHLAECRSRCARGPESRNCPL